jgi:hypothetical protein
MTRLRGAFAGLGQGEPQPRVTPASPRPRKRGSETEIAADGAPAGASLTFEARRRNRRPPRRCADRRSVPFGMCRRKEEKLRRPRVAKNRGADAWLFEKAAALSTAHSRVSGNLKRHKDCSSALDPRLRGDERRIEPPDLGLMVRDGAARLLTMRSNQPQKQKPGLERPGCRAIG